MHTPRYHDVRDESLATDQKLLERTQLLLEHAIRRQVWLLFLDDEARQLPLIMPSYVPRRPGKREAGGFGRFLASVVADCGAASVVLVLERPGRDGVGDDDREWFRLMRDACAAENLTLRGPMLCHNTGVRWVAVEDYAMG